jgi:hypothetical protein
LLDRSIGDAEFDRMLLSKGREGVVMATFREEQMQTGWRRTRWLVLTAIAVAIVVAVVLVLVYSGGGGSGGGGGGY